MGKIQIIIMIFIIIILFITYFKDRFKKTLINKISKLLKLLQYNEIGNKTSRESLQYLIRWGKNLSKKVSLIFWIKYFIYIKYKFLGKFLNSNNYNF